MKKAETMEDLTRTVAQPLLLSIPDVAASLGLGRSKVYELIAKEGLPVIRFGRSVRVSAASLQKWVEQNENTSSWHCWHLSYLFMRCVDRPISLSESVSAALILSLVCLLKQCQFTCKLLAFPFGFLSC